MRNAIVKFGAGRAAKQEMPSLTQGIEKQTESFLGDQTGGLVDSFSKLLNGLSSVTEKASAALDDKATSVADKVVAKIETTKEGRKLIISDSDWQVWGGGKKVEGLSGTERDKPSTSMLGCTVCPFSQIGCENAYSATSCGSDKSGQGRS